MEEEWENCADTWRASAKKLRVRRRWRVWRWIARWKEKKGELGGVSGLDGAADVTWYVSGRRVGDNLISKRPIVSWRAYGWRWVIGGGVTPAESLSSPPLASMTNHGRSVRRELILKTSNLRHNGHDIGSPAVKERAARRPNLRGHLAFGPSRPTLPLTPGICQQARPTCMVLGSTRKVCCSTRRFTPAL